MSKKPLGAKPGKAPSKGKSSQLKLWIGLGVALLLILVLIKGNLFGPPSTEGVLYAQPVEFNAEIQQPGAVLVDVRTVGEWNRGHLPNARRIGMEQLEAQIAAQVPDKNTPVLVYCQSGSRSAFAASILKRMGYTKVTNLVGGIESWSRSGGPITTN